MASLFISHGSADRRFVEEELIGLFRALGFESWYAEEDIASAEEWERSIQRGLEASKWFVLVMSRTAASSNWVKAEAAWAVKRRSGTIIPILLDDVTPEQFNILLGTIQYVDYRGGKTKNGRERLINLLINAEYRPQSLAAVLDGVTRCPSKEMLTLVRIVSRGDGQEATIIAANEMANRFYGRMAGRSVAGTSLEDLFTKTLSQWMDSQDFDRFVADQGRMLAAVKRGEEIYAKVPFRINQNHPIRVRGRSYLPITIAYSRPQMEQGIVVEDYLVHYVRLDDLGNV
jgi:hypothetical protein